MNTKITGLVFVSVLVLCSCESRSEQRTKSENIRQQENAGKRMVSDKELSLIKLVAEGWKPIDGRVYFLTATAFKDWDGGLKNYESRVYQDLKNAGIAFGLGTETTFNDKGRVIEKTSGKECWLTWISLKGIDSDTIEVDSGVWSGPLGGGGGVETYQYRQGRWMAIKREVFWVS